MSAVASKAFQFSMTALALAGLAWCESGQSQDKPAAPAKVNYDEHLVPIFRDKCFSCHNADKTEGGLNLTTYSTMMTGGLPGRMLSSQWSVSISVMRKRA